MRLSAGLLVMADSLPHVPDSKAPPEVRGKDPFMKKTSQMSINVNKSWDIVATLIAQACENKPKQ